MSEMSEVSSYDWPQANKTSMATALPRQLLRFRRSWDKRLFPVEAVVTKHNGFNDVWGCDDYQVDVSNEGILSVRDVSSGVIVNVYNIGAWSRIHHQYRDERGQTADVTRLEVVEEGSDAAR